MSNFRTESELLEFSPIHIFEDNTIRDSSLIIKKEFDNNIEKQNNNKIGCLFTYLYIKGNPKIVIGPDCLIILMFLVISNYLYFLWNGLHIYLKISIIGIYILQFIFYSMTALCNPGLYISHKKDNESDKDNYKFCSKCGLMSHKSDKVEHCNTCEVCFLERDHHCPWTTKCVAKGNLIYFYTFVVSSFTLVLLLYIGVFSFLFGNK